MNKHSFHDRYEYQDGKLIWKIGRRKGREAGCLGVNGRWYVQFFGKLMRRYQIIWNMFHGPIPEGLEMDHINRNPLDDRIENLRVVTRSVNNFNRDTAGASGFRGVVEVRGHPRTKKWRASIYIDRKMKVLGLFATPEEAFAARLEAEKEDTTRVFS